MGQSAAQSLQKVCIFDDRYFFGWITPLLRPKNKSDQMTRRLNSKCITLTLPLVLNKKSQMSVFLTPADNSKKGRKAN
ncbi:MAG: hypothetical protein ACI8R9_002057 [Paraglaciecola sp.]|jgi:hypothetical protein